MVRQSVCWHLLFCLVLSLSLYLYSFYIPPVLFQWINRYDKSFGRFKYTFNARFFCWFVWLLVTLSEINTFRILSTSLDPYTAEHRLHNSYLCAITTADLMYVLFAHKRVIFLRSFFALLYLIHFEEIVLRLFTIMGCKYNQTKFTEKEPQHTNANQLNVYIWKIIDVAQMGKFKSKNTN